MAATRTDFSVGTTCSWCRKASTSSWSAARERAHPDRVRRTETSIDILAEKRIRRTASTSTAATTTDISVGSSAYIRDGWTEYYRKVGTRRAQAISKMCFAAAMKANADCVIDDVRIALGSVAPAVVRARAAESALRGQRIDPSSIAAAERALAEDIAPIDDIRSTAWYRLSVARRVLRQWLEGSTT